MANGTWKIARRGNAQLPLVIVLVLAVVLVLVGKAQSGLFDHARARITDAMAPLLEDVRAPLDGVQRWMSSIGNIFSVYSENLRLKEENARLRQWRNTSVVLEGRLQHYEALLHAVPDQKLHAALARVVGRTSHPFLRTMILDAGSDDGAKAGQAVMDEKGMVGRLFLTGKHTSWVILLTDINSRVPVTVAPGSVQAILAGDNSAAPKLDLLLSTAKVKPGDQVVSSGDGGLLPPALPIGTVVQDGNGLRVALLADATQSESVEILNFARAPETPPATSQLPAEAAGLKPLAPPPPAAPTPSATPATPPPAPLPKLKMPVIPSTTTASGGSAPE
ncbi:MAG: rod shape-determining protein MreC [Alphaproteobacteria bacterium]|nr:rod shape-determining protein MreC [Alphaproteobacteria bacterium]